MPNRAYLANYHILNTHLKGERTMVEPKFTVGQLLKPVVDKTGLIILQVIEVTTHTCYSGTQIYYDCRVHTQQAASVPASMTRGLFKFSEIEVKLHEDML